MGVIPKDNSNDLESTQTRILVFDGERAPHFDPIEEKTLIRKLDIYLSPLMTVIFLRAYLDRANIGNAASAGMTQDLGMSSGDIGRCCAHYFALKNLLLLPNLVAVTLFYATYVAGEIPPSLLLKKLHPSESLKVNAKQEVVDRTARPHDSLFDFLLVGDPYRKWIHSKCRPTLSLPSASWTLRECNVSLSHSFFKRILCSRATGSPGCLPICGRRPFRII